MKNIFSLKTSKSRMILLFIVDVITIIVNSYLALIVRYKMDGNTVPVEDLASVNTYLLINIVTTMIIFLYWIYIIESGHMQVFMRRYLFVQRQFYQQHFRHLEWVCFIWQCQEVFICSISFSWQWQLWSQDFLIVFCMLFKEVSQRTQIVQSIQWWSEQAKPVI